MDCRRAEELLSDHLEGQLGPPLLGELSEHLAACQECRHLRARLEDVLEALDELRRSEVPAPAGLAERVAARTWACRAAMLRSARPPLSALQAAAIFLAVLAAWSALGGLSPTAVRRFSARLLEKGSTTSAYLRESKERVEDEVRLLNVVLGTAFEDNLERVGQRVEDYRKLLGPRRAPDGGSGAQSRSGVSPRGLSAGIHSRREPPEDSGILSNRREAHHVPRDEGQAASAAGSLEGAGA